MTETQATENNTGEAFRVDRKLLELLVCPLTKETLRYDADAEELISEGARLAYPIRDGIPIMLPDAARMLDDPQDDPTAKGRAALGAEE